MDLKKSTLFSVTLAGATAMASQIIFLREFLITFYGNEISIGIILAGWLAWGAAGSILLGRFSDTVRSKVRLFYACQLALAVILPFVLMGIRLSRTFMGINTGEIVGYYPMMLATFSLLCLPCLLLGFMFSLACRVYSAEKETPAGRIARVYMMESIGAILGGALVSYFLIPLIEPFSIIFMLAGLNLCGAMVMQRHDDNKVFGKMALSVTAVVFVLGLVVLAGGGDAAVNRYSLRRLWSGFDVMDSKDSVYGNITVTKRGDQVSFYENGLHLYTVPDVFTAEQSVHFAMLEDPHPQKVLLIGGGVGGLLKEVLKYDVAEVDYVELDPLVIKMARTYLSQADSALLSRPEVRLINGDGRFYVKRTRKKYDCVMIALGDPYTAQLNRFYTIDFFREVERILSDEGVVSFALTASANYIGDELADYLRSIYRSVRAVFPQVMIVPGDTMIFLAANRPGMLTSDVKVLMDRMKERGVQAEYVREYYIFDTLSPERMQYAARAVEKGREVSLNTDFKPISYYYATVFWGTQFDVPGVRLFLRSISAEKIWILAVFLCFFALLSGLWSRTRRRQRAVLLAVMTTGFAEIIFQITVILSFQVIYGYVFYKIGVIITSFMLGLALGSMLVARLMRRMKDDMGFFIATQVSICIYPLVLPIVFWLFAEARPAAMDWLGANIVFPLLPVMAGMIGGIQFPVANKIYLGGGGEVGKASALNYGVDLLGACIGSLLAASLLVPVLGIFGTCLMTALINVTVLALLLVSREKNA